MIINHEFNLNDEYYGQASTGVRKATAVYNGPRYLYIDVELDNGQFNGCFHKSDEPDLEGALEFSMQDDDDPETPPCRCVEIDAVAKPLLACWVTGTYTIDPVPTYEETLSNGEKWIEDYPESSRLEELFNMAEFVFDVETGDWPTWKFHEPGQTEEEFFENIEQEIVQQQLALEENIYKDSQIAEINSYIDRLRAFKQKVIDTGIPHYKLEYPQDHDVPL